MSKVKIEGNASGTGTLTIAAPNTNTDRTLTLPDGAGEILVNGTTSNVGIGTSSPSRTLEIDSSGNRIASLTHTAGTYAFATFSDTNTTDDGQVRIGALTNDLLAFAGGSERMRIDSSGNVLVGKTSANLTTTGVELSQIGQVKATRAGTAAYFNRTSTDGSIAEFLKDGTPVGLVGVAGNDDLYIAGSTGSTKGIYLNQNGILPANQGGGTLDNGVDLGQSNVRYDDVYATNGSIQTSDRNEKQDIEELSEAEQRVAVACKGLLRKFRWQDAVAKKGDDARIHFGIIAQDLQDAFAAEGLDAGRYAMFISSTWWETQTEVPAVEAVDAVLDDEGNVIEEAVEAQEAYIRTDTYETAEEAPEGATERTRLGVRYPELLAFIIAAI